MLKQFSFEISILAVILFLYIFISGASFLKSDILNPNYLFDWGSGVVHGIYSRIATPENYSLFKTVLTLLALFFITIIFYCGIRLFEIRKKEHAHLHHEMVEYARKREREKELEKEYGTSKNERWNKALSHLFSSSSSDWKLAIIEADSMLADLTVDLGFKGETLGDRLKMANQDTLRGLSHAWEAHTVRNKIAHEGLTFEISQHEAKRILALYEQIFRNYGYI